MLKEYYSLTSTLLRNSFRRNDTDKKKRIIIMLVMFFGFLPLLILLGYGAYQITPKAIEADIFMELLVVVITGSQFAVFFFGIFSILAYMFFSEDAEFLAALPVKKTTLFVSKLTMVYINELIISFVILLPLLSITGISAINYGLELGAGYFVMVALAILLMPLIPLLLVSLLAFPMMYVVTFFRRRAVMSSVVLIVLFLGFMGLYLGLMGGLTNGGEEPTFELGEQYLNALNKITNIVFFNTFFVKAMLGIGNVALNFFGFIITLIASLVITIVFSSSLYHKSVMSQLESPKELGGKGAIEDQRGISNSFFIKDFKMLIRNPGFAFQSFMGPFIAPLMVFFIAKSLNVTMDMPEGEEAFVFSAIRSTGVVMFLLLMLLCGTNFVASVAFTREGKYFYFNKYLPIPYKQMINGKIMFSAYTALVGVVLSTIAYGLSIDTNIFNIIMFGVSLAIMSYAFIYMGIYRDLRKPKLEWNNVQEAVKQNLNAMFPMIIGSIIGIAIVIFAMMIETIIKSQFLAWTILWISVIIPAIIILMYYMQKLDNNYVEMLDKITC